MGKRKFKEEIKDDYESDNMVDDVPKKKRKGDEDHQLELTKKKEKDSEQQGEAALFETSMKIEKITFAEACAIIKKNPQCGLRIVKERRHVSLPYHLMSGKIKEALEHICKLQLNKYRGTVGGAVIAVNYKGIKLISKSRVIDDQPCFHCQTITPLVVFSPSPGQTFEATITSISEGFITALIYGVITVNIDLDRNMKKTKTVGNLDVGNIVNVSCDCLKIKRGMCQMKGILGKFVRKGTKDEIGSIPIVDQRNVINSPLQQKKAFRLDDADDEE